MKRWRLCRCVDTSWPVGGEVLRCCVSRVHLHIMFNFQLIHLSECEVFDALTLDCDACSRAAAVASMHDART